MISFRRRVRRAARATDTAILEPAAQDAALGGMTMAPDEARAEIDRLKEMVMARDAKLSVVATERDNLKTMVETRDRKIADLKDGAGQLHDRAEAQVSKVATRDERISELRAQVEQLQSKHESAWAMLATRDARIAQLSADAERRAAEIESLKTTVDDLRRNDTNLRAMIVARDDKIVGLRKQLVRADRQIKELEANLEGLQARLAPTKAFEAREAELRGQLRRLERRGAQELTALQARMAQEAERSETRDVVTEIAAWESETARARLLAERHGGHWPDDDEEHVLTDAMRVGRASLARLDIIELAQATSRGGSVVVAHPGQHRGHAGLMAALSAALGRRPDHVRLDGRAFDAKPHDLVIAQIALDAAPDPFEAADRIFRLCAPGGAIILAGDLQRASAEAFTDPWRAQFTAYRSLFPRVDWERAWWAWPLARVGLELIDPRLAWDARAGLAGAAGGAPPFANAVALGRRQVEA